MKKKNCHLIFIYREIASNGVQKCCLSPLSAPGITLPRNTSDFNEKETDGAETKLAMIRLGGSTSPHGSITGLDPNAGESQKEGFNMLRIQHFRGFMRTTGFI